MCVDLSKGAPPTKTLRRASRVELPTSAAELKTPSPSKASETETSTRKKKVASPSPGQQPHQQQQTRRKPTLIRNLGGAGPAKG